MSVETDIRALLLAHPAVAALVADRVAQDAVPKGETYPMLVFSVRHDRTLGLGTVALADACSVAFQCWAGTGEEAAELADAVELAVASAPARHAAVVLERATTFDEDLEKDGVLLAGEWWA